MTLAWKTDVQPATRRLVLLALADSASDEGACWPYMATIARKAGVGLSTARKACADLEQDGLLRRELRRTTTTSGAVTNQNSLYHIDVNALRARAEASSATPAKAERTPASAERTPARIERTPPPESSGPPARIEREENRKKNHQVEPNLNQDAPADADAAADASKLNGGQVVAAFVDAYRAAHQGHDPLSQDVRKVAGTAKRLLADPKLNADVLLAAATALGRSQFTDLAGQYRRQLAQPGSGQRGQGVTYVQAEVQPGRWDALLAQQEETNRRITQGTPARLEV
jgi:hypothetical protein